MIGGCSFRARTVLMLSALIVRIGFWLILLDRRRWRADQAANETRAWSSAHGARIKGATARPMKPARSPHAFAPPPVTADAAVRSVRGGSRDAVFSCHRSSSALMRVWVLSATRLVILTLRARPHGHVSRLVGSGKGGRPHERSIHSTWRRRSGGLLHVRRNPRPWSVRRFSQLSKRSCFT